MDSFPASSECGAPGKVAFKGSWEFVKGVAGLIAGTPCVLSNGSPMHVREPANPLQILVLPRRLVFRFQALPHLVLRSVLFCHNHAVCSRFNTIPLVKTAASQPVDYMPIRIHSSEASVVPQASWEKPFSPHHHASSISPSQLSEVSLPLRFLLLRNLKLLSVNLPNRLFQYGQIAV